MTVEADPSAVFTDFGDSALLRKQDGSASASTSGLYDEAEIEHPHGNGTVRSKQPQITVPVEAGAAYGEGDEIDMKGKTFEILDAFPDEKIITYRVREAA